MSSKLQLTEGCVRAIMNELVLWAMTPYCKRISNVILYRQALIWLSYYRDINHCIHKLRLFILWFNFKRNKTSEKQGEKY